MSDEVEPTAGRIPWRTILAIVGITIVALIAATEFLAQRPQSRLGDALAMVTPPRAGASSPGPEWTSFRDHAEHALTAGDINRALRAWHEGYALALASRGWEPMAEMGDLYVRIGEVSNGLSSARPTVRRAYLTALVRARRDRSVDGVLRAGEGFMRLGDEEMSRVCLVLAGQITPDVGYGSSVKP